MRFSVWRPFHGETQETGKVVDAFGYEAAARMVARDAFTRASFSETTLHVTNGNGIIHEVEIAVVPEPTFEVVSTKVVS